MFTGFFYALRRYGLDVSLNEWLTLMEALRLGLHGSQLTDFYELARCVLAKSEADFDRFDLAFAEYFRDVESVREMPAEFLNWLAEAIQRREFDKDGVDARFGGGFNLEELKNCWRSALPNRRSDTTAAENGWVPAARRRLDTAAITLPASESEDPDGRKVPFRWRRSGTTGISDRIPHWSFDSFKWRFASFGT